MTIIPISAVGAALLNNTSAGIPPQDVAPVVDWRPAPGTYQIQVIDPATGKWVVKDTVTVNATRATVGTNLPVQSVRLVIP